MKYVSTKTFAAFFGLFFSSALFAADVSVEIGPVGAPGLVKSVKLLGSGCPADSEVSYVSQGDYLFFRFPEEMKAAVGPGISLTSLRKNCSATIEFDSSQSVTVGSIGWFGTADLEKDQIANLNVSWFFQGQGETGTFTAEHKGKGKTWFNNFGGKADKEVWSPCDADRALTINTALRIAGPREEAAHSQLLILGVQLKRKGC